MSPEPTKPTQKVDLEELARLTARSSPPPIPMKSLMPSWFHLPPWLQGGAFMSNTQFLAFMAHAGWAGFATLAVVVLHGTTTALLISTGAWIVAAALKEYGYDARYELPKQTFAMNTQDFIGYCAGLVVAWIIIYLGWP